MLYVELLLHEIDYYELASSEGIRWSAKDANQNNGWRPFLYKWGA